MDKRPPIRQALKDAVEEMVDKGILWQEAEGEFEKLFIVRCLKVNGGNLGAAADQMGVHRNTLSKKVRALGIERARFRGRKRSES